MTRQTYISSDLHHGRRQKRYDVWRATIVTVISMYGCSNLNTCTGFINSNQPTFSRIYKKNQNKIYINESNSVPLTQAKIHPIRTYLGMVYAPPGSGYFRPEDETSYFPDTYEPTMEYPGTMRPGRTPENQPYTSLPILDTDPDPVPWPHFQEIEWHHNWGAPHEHPIPMEEFIEINGRWATAEMEAQMRAGARRGVRERREMEESQKAASFILDDDDDDDDDLEPKLDLGEGVNAFMGNNKMDTNASKSKSVPFVDDDESNNENDFLLDLGLDAADEIQEEDDEQQPAYAANRKDSKGILETMQTMIDSDDDDESTLSLNMDDDDDVTDIDLNFDELGLSFDDDVDTDTEGDDDEIDGEEEYGDDDDIDFFNMIDDDGGGGDDDNDMVPLDDMIGNEDMGDDDLIDDGGFDYDSY